MREDELQQMLGGLATRLDEASEPVDIDWVFAAPRRQGGGGRRSRYLLSIAALVALIAGVTWAWPSPLDEQAQVSSGTEPQVALIDGGSAVADGAIVQVVGSGFDPGSEVSLRQCGPEGCDAWRPPVRAVSDLDGRFTAEVVVFRDIATNRAPDPGPPVRPDWSACEPCTLRAEDGETTAGATVVLVPTPQPLHPTALLVTPGPHAPGQVVRLEGSGFRPDPNGLDVGIAYCAADAQRSEECGGGPADLGDFGIAADGTFVVEKFALPAADVELSGVRCADQPGGCVVTWFLWTPGPLPAGVPLDLSGGGSS